MKNILIALCVLIFGAQGHASAAASAASDLLARSIALYPTLSSYADTGTVVVEIPGSVDRSTFRTYFRQGDSLDFLFDFQGVESQSAGISVDRSSHRLVLWMNAGELQTFNKQLRTHETFPREGGGQVAALQNAGAVTEGAAILIPSLIFSQAELPGTVRTIREARDAGFETVSGRRCHKIIGIAAEYFPSGQMTNVRPVTVWIDAESLLVRKVLEDTPKGYPIDSHYRKTVTIEPTANPKLDAAKFQFTVPTSQQ